MLQFCFSEGKWVRMRCGRAIWHVTKCARVYRGPYFDHVDSSKSMTSWGDWTSKKGRAHSSWGEPVNKTTQRSERNCQRPPLPNHAERHSPGWQNRLVCREDWQQHCYGKGLRVAMRSLQVLTRIQVSWRAS